MLFMLCMVINRLHLKLKWKLRFICAEGYWGTLRAIVCRWIWINLIAGLNCVLPSRAELPGTLNLIRKIITSPPNCSAFGGKHVSTVLGSDRHKHPLEPILWYNPAMVSIFSPFLIFAWFHHFFATSIPTWCIKVCWIYWNVSECVKSNKSLSPPNES